MSMTHFHPGFRNEGILLFNYESLSVVLTMRHEIPPMLLFLRVSELFL